MAKLAKVADATDATTEQAEPTPVAPTIDWSYKAHGHEVSDMRGLPTATLRYALSYGLNKIVQDYVAGDKAEIAESVKASRGGTATEKQTTLLAEAAEEIGRNVGADEPAEAYADAVVNRRRSTKLRDLIEGRVTAPRTPGAGKATSWESIRREAASIVLEELHAERDAAAPGRTSKDFIAMRDKLLAPDAKNAARVEAKAKELSNRRASAAQVVLDL